MNLLKLLFCSASLFLIGCSAAYEKVKIIDTSNPKTFQQYIVSNYQQNASFEAEKMHDWDSAKLYAEKALKALDGEKIYPEEINYWKIPKDRVDDIRSGYNNLLLIYSDAILIDPKNLAKAISSLDCWSEQEEEGWQTWDIEKCKNDFHSAMHGVYENIAIDKKSKDNIKKQESARNVTIVTQNNKKEIMQIIYFDFDDFKLSSVSKTLLINFLNKNKNNLSRYIILGHTDTQGSRTYNLSLSLKRAEAVRKILLNEGITEKKISILGKGEEDTAVITADGVKHPANRRAEVKILN